MKNICLLLLVFLFTAFFSASPAYSEDTPIDSPFTTVMEIQDYAKIEEHPISESGDILESEPVRVQFVQSFAQANPSPSSVSPAPLEPRVKPFKTGNACKDVCFQEQRTCPALPDYSETQSCNDTFMRCLRGCYNHKK